MVLLCFNSGFADITNKHKTAKIQEIWTFGHWATRSPNWAKATQLHHHTVLLVAGDISKTSCHQLLVGCGSVQRAGYPVSKGWKES